MDGWSHGLYMALISYPLYNVVAKYCFYNYETHPLVFTCFMTIWSSLAVLLFSRGSALITETLVSIHTWIIAFIKILTLVLGVYIVTFVSASEASLLLRISSVLIFIITLFMGQSTSKKELAFSLLSFAGIGLMLFSIDVSHNDRILIAVIIFFRGLFQAIEFLSIEFHKANNKAVSKKDTSRVSALVAAISAFVFTIFCLVMGGFKVLLGSEGNQVLAAFSDPVEFFDLKIILITMIAGGLISGVSNYCKFHAGKTISAKYLLALISLQPLAAMFYEFLLSKYNMASLRDFGMIDGFAFAFVILGNIGVALAGVKILKKVKTSNATELNEKYNLVSQDQVQHAKELVSSSAKFYQNNLELVAKNLEVKDSIVIDLLSLSESEDYRLSNSNFNSITKNYYQKVSTRDGLTGLYNRSRLEQKTQEMIDSGQKFHLCFIDLDKFKAINDIYGHDAGDEALKYTAELMEKANPDGFNGRNGGDEFIMIIFDKHETVIDKFIKLLSKDLSFNGNKIPVGASLGLSYCKDDSLLLDDLIKVADENMYSNKKTT